MAWYLLGKESKNEKRIRELEESLLDDKKFPGDELMAEREEDAERATYENSSTPWVKIIGESVEGGRLSFKLDWNGAFIDRLKSSGYDGVDDTQRVQKWLAQTAMDVARDMGQEYFDQMLAEPDVELDLDELDDV